MRLEGTSAIVTGGAGGLGSATVRRLVAAGVHVVIADVADDAAKALSDELGDFTDYVRTDVTLEDDVQTAIEKAGQAAPLRLAVSAHGGFTSVGRTVNRDGTPLDLDGFRRTLDGYLTGTFNVMRLAAAAMVRGEPDEAGNRGVAVNTASIAAFEGQIGQLPYAAAKGGVAAMTIAAARDLAAAGVRVLAIAPGTFFTPAFGMSEEDAHGRFAAAVPYPKRMGQPTEYAHLVQSIAENDYLNGEVIRLDGALRFGPK